MTSRTQGKNSFAVTIASSGTTSGSAYLNDHVLCGFALPATFTGTSVTFQGSLDGSTFYTVYDETNTAITVNVTQGRAYSLNVVDFAAWPYIKIVSGSAEGGARIVTLFAARALEDR